MCEGSNRVYIAHYCPYIYMAIAAPTYGPPLHIHGRCCPHTGHYYPHIYMAVTTPINARITAPIYVPLLRLTTVRPRRLNISRLHYCATRRH